MSYDNNAKTVSQICCQLSYIHYNKYNIMQSLLMYGQIVSNVSLLFSFHHHQTFANYHFLPSFPQDQLSLSCHICSTYNNLLPIISDLPMLSARSKVVFSHIKVPIFAGIMYSKLAKKERKPNKCGCFCKSETSPSETNVSHSMLDVSPNRAIITSVTNSIMVKSWYYRSL